MPLSMVNAGEPFTIKRIGGKEEVKRHLEELGFVVGGVLGNPEGNSGTGRKV